MGRIRPMRASGYATLIVLAVGALHGSLKTAANPQALRSPVEAVAVEFLGNPSAARYDRTRAYARNVWDMQSFDGRVYIGSGNSNNRSPAPNAGPVEVWSFDPGSGQFGSEFLLDEEQLAVFRVASDELLIPGHDPREPWQFGNFYRLHEGQWDKVRSIPDAVHTYDLIEFRGALYAAVSTSNGGGEVHRSVDRGSTWKRIPIGGKTTICDTNSGQCYTVAAVARCVSLFTLNDKIYVSSRGRLPEAKATGPRVDVVEGDALQRIRADLFPGIPYGEDVIVVRPVNYAGHLVFLGATAISEHHWAPRGLFVASSIDTAQRIELPSGELPYDIAVHNGQCYLLTNTRPDATANSDQHMIHVWRTDDLRQWVEIVRFPAPTFARSLEVLDGDIYFGLGCDPDRAPQETGAILRVRRDRLGELDPSVGHGT